MASAPVRASRTRTPGNWGVPVKATLMVVDIMTDIVIVAVGVISFVRDVDRLVRTGSGSDLVADLESGRYFLYDEDDGVDLGPLDVKITRVSDGLGVVPTEVDNGPSYNVAGNRGSAALSFDLPSAGGYRIEAATGVGQIASFAVGRDVGGGPFAALIRGLLIGGAIFTLGLVLTIWGVVQRGRARLRARAEAALEQGRRAVDATAGSINDPEQRRHVATHHGRRLSQTAAERAGTAPAPVRDGLEGASARVETAVGDLAASTEAPAEIVGRLGESLGRSQERLAAGESLRIVARDSVSELREVGSDTRREAMESYAATRSAATDARAGVDARRRGVVDRPVEVSESAEDEAHRSLVAAERNAEETVAEIGIVLDNAASDITAAAMRSAEEINEEAKAAIDAASAELRAVSARPSTPDEVLPPPPPPPPPPAPTPGRPAAKAADEGSGSTRHELVGLARAVPLAPPPSSRLPVAPHARGADTERRADAGSADPAGRPYPPEASPRSGFTALAPPPIAIVRTGAQQRAEPADAARRSDADVELPDPIAAPLLAPPPTGRRPDRSNGPGAAVPPG